MRISRVDDDDRHATTTTVKRNIWAQFDQECSVCTRGVVGAAAAAAAAAVYIPSRRIDMETTGVFVHPVWLLV